MRKARRRSFFAPVVLLVIAAAAPAFAQVAPSDPAASREQLLEGFQLKKDGRLAEARVHLLESVHLDPNNAKAWLNLADCEERLHKLVDAQGHWVAARDRASEHGDDVIRDEATSRLARLDAQLPTLVVKLAPGAPPDTHVARDGVALGTVSLGTALPGDPGKHTVTASASGYPGRSFDVALEEGTQTELVVDPGEKATQPPATVSSANVSSRSRAWQTAGAVVGGTGVVGLALGSIFGVTAIVQKNEAGCPGNVCSGGAGGTSASEHDSALTSAHFSTGFFVAGGVLLATGASLWFFAPRSESSPGPKVGLVGSEIVVRRTW